MTLAYNFVSYERMSTKALDYYSLTKLYRPKRLKRRSHVTRQWSRWQNNCLLWSLTRKLLLLWRTSL